MHAYARAGGPSGAAENDRRARRTQPGCGSRVARRPTGVRLERAGPLGGPERATARRAEWRVAKRAERASVPMGS